MKKKVSLLVGLLYSLIGLSQADDITATVEWAAPMPKTNVRIIHSDSSNFYYAGKVSSGFLSSDNRPAAAQENTSRPGRPFRN